MKMRRMGRRVRRGVRRIMKMKRMGMGGNEEAL